ncbi:kinesin-like protein KIF26A isoform X2 [Sorex araneus]|uniref:kinesin-like protein KIF26A isoform X2 n=1 Tax=Sorex araneus TaxID=42254 RepID=UPI002433C3EB|nr:kinesin-like protein KIF26A isoform X2 [Sorex araneus]
MALPGPPEAARGAPRKAPSLLEMGALCLDSDIILGFTSHLLRRRAKVAEGAQARELSPCNRPAARPEPAPRGSRPAPEGAGEAAGEAHAAGGGGWCRHCHTKLGELKRQAWRLVSGPGTPLRTPCLPPPACHPDAEHCPPCGSRLHPLQEPAAPEWSRGLAWPPGHSLQVSVVPAGLGGALSTVTFQAAPCLRGLPGPARACLAEAAVAAVAVADTVRDPTARPDRGSEMWGRGGACTAALVSPASGSAAGTSFFIRAAQKLSLASKRKKPAPPPAPAPRSTPAYPTDFSGVLQLWPPPVPPCLLRAASKAKENPGLAGKVKVLLRVWPAQGPEATSFLKVDPRRKQVTLYDPAAGLPGRAGPRRASAATAPKMFAFDAVFPQDSEQAEVCSGAVADVLQCVVGGADGCIFSFGPRSLGTAHTMIGKDSSPQSLGVVPCAISWLFRLLEERRERTGTRFSIRVSAVEVCGRDASLRDLLAEVAPGGLQDTQSPGVCLREDPVCGAQTQSELRAPTAEQAASYLDAALAARGASREDTGAAHLLFTLHVYQYRLEKCGKGAMLGGRSRLHLIDLGSLERGPDRGGEGPGGPLCLSLSALGSVILALVSGAKHVPYREHRLTMLLRESLATHSGRTTMIAHVSDSPAWHAETLGTVQLAARIHRLRRKKAKCASSSSGGDSSCEEGRARRPPALRPLQPRALAPEPRRQGPGDPDYSSSSEQSCDTVIYVGPEGTVLSDRELTDNEGPPDFVPIVPALSRRRPSQDPRDADHFRCGTFAELQERLQGMHGDAGGALAGRRPSAPAAGGSPRAACPSTPRGAPRCEPPAGDKDSGPTERRPLPDPAPSPPQEPGVRVPPVGRPCPAARGHPAEHSLLTATVTLQQPVVLNGEDELVFTVVEELPLGGPGRRASLASFSSDCSLQALASGSRPVSIISSVNDEFDAYTLRAAARSHTSSISSWLSEVEAGVSPDPLSPSSPAGPGPRHTPTPDGSPEDSCSRASERARVDSPGLVRGSRPEEGALPSPAHSSQDPPSPSPRGVVSTRTLHSSLPRKARTSSAAVPSPPGPGGPFEDPWLLRAEECGSLPAPPASPAPVLASARRLVEGGDGAARASRGLGPAQPPPLRRGATTLGVTTAPVPGRAAEAAACPGGSKVAAGGKKSVAPRPAASAPPAPPVRKSSLEPRGSSTPALPRAEEMRASAWAEHCGPRATSSLKGRPGKVDAAGRAPVQGCVERSEGPAPGKASREAAARPARAVPRLGVPPTSPTAGPGPAFRGSSAKAVGVCKPPAGAGKGRSLGTAGSRAPATSVKPPPPAAARTPVGPVQSPRVTPRSAPSVGTKAGRGTIMGTKQALRAAHSRVHELAAGGGAHWGSADSDSGNDSGVTVGEERPGPALPSPYSTVTAPRRPQRCSSGHGSDTSSVLSGELPPAMGRTALFYQSGASSGYESVVRDSEATGSASSAPDSLSDSGAASPGSRARSLRAPKRRAVGPQRRRLIPTPLPDTSALGRKPSLPGQWVDLPPPLAGVLKEPFEIKVYEIDDVERLQRLRPPPREDPAEPSQDVEKGLVCAGVKLRLAERRQQRLREVLAKHTLLRGELAETQGRLMLEPGRWLEQFEVGPELERESAEHLAALERATAALERCVNLCKAHVMMVTCFDISVASPAAAPGPQEVDV